MSEPTRDRIIHTAFRLFREHGYAATGVATILKEAGVNPGSMYHAFESKEALLASVLEYALELLGPTVMEPVEAATPDPVERVFALLAHYRAGMARAGCRTGCPIGNLALEVSDADTEARTLIHRYFERWAARVRGWLEAAGDRLPSTTDREALARHVLAVMEGGLMQARAAGELAPFDETAGLLRDYFERLQAAAARGGVASAEAPPAAKDAGTRAEKPPHPRDGAFLWEDR